MQTMKRDGMTNLEQADAMVMLLLSNGRETPHEDSFSMCHDDILLLLELIRARLVAAGEG
jgi:hypothetical protein